ncbi:MULTISPECIES: 2-keto-4-pentenoate hydratase [Rhodococcus]|uniref:2-keto-4-pentenoate hydratase n=1 Tax=Rhodococcus oxybenzonivorans TaxID=1990687 RepID=A0AAE5A613_9NOCA|nr:MULTISPECIES: 2-keto-4-pentenoate hydratase [Rhodococcus]MDV7241805.1 2-keto-4-pentenoate hydratase [Rhodococcus oxybenzonivorans]MDV7265430.1 2-keto-4-pentenoate hydratase [Rhodococcus oxybenzonivorans]MDV7273661.1 2-keto-4-pentenoate hydratase [Rhodococcus oxybenzonivorans]MDV7334087.1 2-keto-4-pentenoate hydratase [Rhodococcus oxybenzonivorans]MDV7343506.1 2-keto-4-pentenoate hydratase [Rhodococcus oxybenzonivorans]
MTLNEEDVRQLASELWEAERLSAPINPISGRYPDADLDDAYRIQLQGVQLRAAGGDVVRGHKVGLTARVMQEQFGVDRPDFGHLLASMFHPEGVPLPVDSLIAPRVEAELAFVLDAPLKGPGVTVADVLAATSFVLPALEIIDSRIQNWQIGIVDTVADNASSAKVILGGTRTSITDLDPRLIGVVLRRNGEIVETGASGAVLGNPVQAVAWLANTIASHGGELRPGDLIMPGTCTRAVHMQPGDTIRADFEHLGHVGISFSAAARSTQEEVA